MTSHRGEKDEIKLKKINRKGGGLLPCLGISLLRILGLHLVFSIHEMARF